MERFARILAVIPLTTIAFSAPSSAQTPTDQCNEDGLIAHAANQIASGYFDAADATIDTIEMIGCKANSASCARIVQMRTDVINKQGDGWAKRAEKYKNLWTRVDCKPAS